MIFIIESQLSYAIFTLHALRVYIVKSNIKSLKIPYQRNQGWIRRRRRWGLSFKFRGSF